MKKLIVFLIIGLLLGGTLGYFIGKYNLLSAVFVNYNLKHVTSYILDKKSLPRVLNETSFAFRFADNGNNDNFITENVTIKIIEESNDLGGFYWRGNEIYVVTPTRTLVGHELCHLILNRYGINDVVANEQICYTLGENYRLR